MLPLDDFFIHVDGSTLTRSLRGGIAGVIHIKVGGLAFPELQWSDLVVRMLIMWLENIGDLHCGRAPSGSLYFMDGPFRADVSIVGDGKWSVALVDSNRVNMVGHVEAIMVIRAVLHAAQRIVVACQEQDWHSRDLVHLSQLVRSMQEAVDDV